MTATEFPQKMGKKMKLLSYFKRYMIEHLIEAEGSAVVESETLSRIPHLHTWFRYDCAAVMHLTNGSVHSTLSEIEISNDLYQRLRYAHEKLNNLIYK